MALPVRKGYTGNGVQTTLTSSPTISDTTFTVAAVVNWPASFPYFVVVDAGTSKEEKMKVTAVSSSTLTVVRGADNTTAVAHVSGASIYPVFTASEADEANQVASIMTTKGDLIATDGSAINRLAVGATNTHVLQVDSTATNGFKWGQVATAGIADSAITSAKIADGSIVDADINASAAIVDTKLATIATAGKVSDSATTATNLNTPLTIVRRDASGNFVAGTITAALTGNVTGNVTGSVTGSVTGTASGNLVAGGALGTPSSGTLTNCTFPTLNQSTNQNAATATALQTARNIGGVSFNGTANIDLPGVNVSGTQDTSGNAATATLAADSSLLDGKDSSITGTANTIALLDNNGILAAEKHGMSSGGSFWVASDYSGTTLFRSSSSGVYAQLVSSARTVLVNSAGTLGNSTSSRRFKENIVPYVDTEDKLLEVSLVTFDYKPGLLEADAEDTDRFNQFGLIAEDLHDAGLNHLVHYDKDNQPEAINYTMLSVELLGVVKNQNQRLIALEARLTQLENN